MSKQGESESVSNALREILRYIGEDPDREGLKGTPGRIIRSWSKLYGGYNQIPSEIMKADFSADGYDQMVVLKGIEFWSTCEHHMLPFFGEVSVGYLPGKDGRVVGISKLARAVEIFARRLQIQERMTGEIADAVQECTGAQGTGVIVKAQHLCMVARGIEKQRSWMVTSALRGSFKTDPKTREEFLSLVKKD